MKRKFLAMLMAVVLIVGLMPTSVMAEAILDSGEAASIETSVGDEGASNGGETGEPAGDEGASNGGETGEPAGDEDASNGGETGEPAGDEDASNGGETGEPAGDEGASNGGETGEPAGDEGASNGDETGEPAGDEGETGEGDPEGAGQPAAINEAAGTVELNLLYKNALRWIKLYPYNTETKEKDTENEIEILPDGSVSDGKQPQGNKTVNVTPGTYWVEGYSKSSCETGTYRGGMTLTVGSEAIAYNIACGTYLALTDTSWKPGTDYTVNVTLTSADSYTREAETSIVTMSSKQYYNFIFALTDNTQVEFVSLKEPDANWTKPTISVTPTTTIGSYDFSKLCPEKLVKVYPLTVTAPEGATVAAGEFYQYYTYEFYPAEEETDNGNGTKSWTFQVPYVKGYDYGDSHMNFIRVQHPEGVTYWTFGTWNKADGASVTVTEKDLKIGDSKYTKDRVVKDFSENTYDTGNIYLGTDKGYSAITTSGYINLNAVGNTRELNVWRNWQAKDTYWPTMVALPDVHYTILDPETGEPFADGEAPITITPTENNSSQATIKAVSQGTAMVLVTYDAVTHTDAMAKVDTEQVTFSAIWPENTGVLMISVGKSSSVKANMTLRNLSTEDGTMKLDSELDILYYTEEEGGASYSFTPETSGCTVTVARATVTDSAMTFNGFSDENVTEEDGTFTVSGLTEGRHVIKVTPSSGNPTYQVVTVKEASWRVVHKSNNKPVTASDPAKPGETVVIQYSGLVNPMEHLAGVYNNAPALYLRDQHGNVTDNNPHILGGYYNFSSSSKRQQLEITVPRYHDSETVTVEGTLYLSGFGDAKGNHRTHTYSKVAKVTGNSPNSVSYLSRLPVVTFATVAAEYQDCQLVFKTETTTLDPKDVTVKLIDADGRDVTVNEDGSFRSMPGEHSYVLFSGQARYDAGIFTVTDGGNNTFTLNLKDSLAGAWDGMTETEPTQVDGVYQISTGAEMAWFSKQNKTNKAVKGVLTADIDLGDYPWNNAWDSSWNVNSHTNATVLDGAGHTITGLNATDGLFAKTASGSEIKNLTVEGKVEGTLKAGGFVGVAMMGTTFQNCVNKASVKGGSAGGILGSIMNPANASTADKETKILNCANYGAVQGATNAGGIVSASIATWCTVKNCYNRGTVNGQAAGGIIGMFSGGYTAQIRNGWSSYTYEERNFVIQYCYSAGTAKKGVVGNLATGSKNYTISGCGYLKTAAAEDGSTLGLSEAELKNYAPKDSDFVVLCEGYPVLPFETDGKTVHAPADAGSVTAPTCTEVGYTTKMCSLCKVTYKTDYVDALGHEKGTEIASEYPVYNYYKCVRAADGCTKTYKVWNDSRYAAMTLADEGITALGMTDTNGGWTTSSNTGKQLETGNEQNQIYDITTTMSFTLSKTAALGFDYGFICRHGYQNCSGDYAEFTLTKNGEAPVTLLSATEKPTRGTGSDGVEQNINETKQFREVLEPGSYTLTLVYKYESKNGVANSDYGFLSNLTLETYDSADEAENALKDYEAAQKVVRQIAALGVITLESKSAVEAARQAYNALTVAQKELVSNLSTLETAEKTLKQKEDEASKPVEDTSVKVTFRLVGSTLSDDDVDLSIGLEGFHGATYQTWIKTTKYTMQEGDTCYDVFKLALDEAGLTWKGSKNWVSAITAPEVLGGYRLAERQNGDFSGWMYTVNGSHVSQTMDEYELQNGDKIVWHYINDYNYEQEDWATGSSGNENLWSLWLKAADRTPGESDRIDSGRTEEEENSVTLNPSATANKKGEATAKVSSSAIKEAVSNAKENDASAIVIEPEIEGDASKITVNVPVSAAASVGKDAKADLTVKTEVGTINLPAEALKNLSGSGDLTISAEAKSNGEVKVTITKGGEAVEMKGTTVTVPAKNSKSSMVLVVVKEDGSEEVLKKSYVGKDGVTGLVSGDCTLKVVEKTVDFGDAANHWAKDAMEFVAARGIFNGTGDKVFSPDRTMSGAMVATVLHRLENSPKANGQISNLNSWAKDSITWAAENGILNGSADQFNGDRPVSRQELATMLYCYAKAIGMNMESKGDLNKFDDGSATADWAKEAMSWAVSNGLFAGRTATTLDPTGSATRAQVAVVIQRLLGLMTK